jgi:hypothetical protein
VRGPSLWPLLWGSAIIVGPMAKPYRYPYPCEYRPQFSSQNDACVFVEQFKKHGKIKNCSYLSVKYSDNFFSGSGYCPACEKDSFKIEGENRDHLFYGCPKDCMLYEPAWKGRARKRLKAVRRSIRNSGIGKLLIELVRAASGFMKQ